MAETSISTVAGILDDAGAVIFTILAEPEFRVKA
jgi:hypothetical protein